MADDSAGLSTAIIGMGDPRDLAQAPLPDVPTLSVLPAGPTPPDSAALLRSDEMTELLRDLSANADLVVVDAPPLLPVADAQVLLDNPAIDAVLVVGRAYHATRDQVRRARTVLDQHRLASLGLVVNGVHGAESSYDYRPVETRRHAPRLRTRA
jgi:receptor protein-tyrosine kinase